MVLLRERVFHQAADGRFVARQDAATFGIALPSYSAESPGVSRLRGERLVQGRPGAAQGEPELVR